jgi:hypothetical protein
MTYINPDITTESLTESIVRGIDARYYNNEILYISIVDEKISVLLPDGNEFIIFIKEV